MPPCLTAERKWDLRPTEFSCLGNGEGDVVYKSMMSLSYLRNRKKFRVSEYSKPPKGKEGEVLEGRALSPCQIISKTILARGGTGREGTDWVHLLLEVDVW